MTIDISAGVRELSPTPDKPKSIIPEAPQQKQFRVLIIEDKENIYQELEKSFGGEKNLSLEFVDGGREALIKLRAAKDEGNTFALLVTNQLVARQAEKRLNLAELVRAVKGEDLCSSVFLWTAHSADQFELAQYERLGIRATIDKANDPGNKNLKTVIEQERARQELERGTASPK
ncbi:MAG: hypothetical protein Q7R51_02205 [bacterium]|nr:hypothetical protein [bacterium]